jgi:hypothetical protein
MQCYVRQVASPGGDRQRLQHLDPVGHVAFLQVDLGGDQPLLQVARTRETLLRNEVIETPPLTHPCCMYQFISHQSSRSGHAPV